MDGEWGCGSEWVVLITRIETNISQLELSLAKIAGYPPSCQIGLPRADHSKSWMGGIGPPFGGGQRDKGPMGGIST